MPSYHVLRFEEIGELDFYGNLGAVAQYEDKSGVSIDEIFKEGNKVKLSSVISFIYECHIVACLRLSKDPIDYEKFKAFADKSFMDVFTKLIKDITDQLGDQKKTTPKVRNQ